MFRGSRVQVPPLHGIADVLGLCLLAVILFLILRWVMGGGSPFQELSGWLSPPKLVTVLQVQIGLTAISAELSALLPARERASHSGSLELAQRVGEVLLRERNQWRTGSVGAVQVNETAGVEAWDAAWLHLEKGDTEARDIAPSAVVLLALVTGRSLQVPERPDIDDVERFVRGLGHLDVRNLDAFGALAVPAAAASNLRPSV